MIQQTVPTIKVGDWTVKESDEGDAELFYRGIDVAAGVSPAQLAKLAKDLMKLAGQLAAAGH